MSRVKSSADGTDEATECGDEGEEVVCQRMSLLINATTTTTTGYPAAVKLLGPRPRPEPEWHDGGVRARLSITPILIVIGIHVAGGALPVTRKGSAFGLLVRSWYQP